MEIENTWFRPAVCYLVEVRGMSMKEVADMFGVYHQVVSHAIKRYNETGKHEDRKGRGRKRTSRDEANIEEARNQLRQNNQTKRRNGVAGNSTRKLGRKLGISRESARRILKKDLKLTPWKKRKGQKLTEKQKQKRLERSKALKERFSQSQHRKILFTDENFFPIEGSFNPQNDRI